MSRTLSSTLPGSANSLHFPHGHGISGSVAHLKQGATRYADIQDCTKSNLLVEVDVVFYRLAAQIAHLGSALARQLVAPLDLHLRAFAAETSAHHDFGHHLIAAMNSQLKCCLCHKCKELTISSPGASMVVIISPIPLSFSSGLGGSSSG